MWRGSTSKVGAIYVSLPFENRANWKPWIPKKTGKLYKNNHLPMAQVIWVTVGNHRFGDNWSNAPSGSWLLLDLFILFMFTSIWPGLRGGVSRKIYLEWFWLEGPFPHTVSDWWYFRLDISWFGAFNHLWTVRIGPLCCWNSDELDRRQLLLSAF